MDSPAILNDFRQCVSAKITLLPEGVDRYRVLTPFQFEDRDHLAIVLKKNGAGWVLSDEGHTYMHLTYDVEEKDLQKGTRQKIIQSALDAFSVEDHDGELRIPVKGNEYGNALYSLVQGLLRIADVNYLTRERVRSTFLDDFKSLLSKEVPPARLQFDWNDTTRDPDRKYVVDCRVNHLERPLLVFALPNDDRVRDANISLLEFERWQLKFRSLAIFEDQEQIHRKVLARFSDVCEKQFSAFSSTQDRIKKYLAEVLSERA